MFLFEKIRRKLQKLTCLKQQKGSVFVMTALMFPILLGMVGFAYDAGNLYIHRGRAQNTVDAAALAGARAFYAEETDKITELRRSLSTSPNNNVRRISSEQRNEIKGLSKTVAKDSADTYIELDMKNLNNSNYSRDCYYLIDKYYQRYFRVELTETVPLHFIQLVTGTPVHEVKAAANCTIPDSIEYNSGAKSVFMVNRQSNSSGGFTIDATAETSFYDSNSILSYIHPTWSGVFDGNLYFTGEDENFNFDLGTNLDAYDGTELKKAFNSKAKALLDTVTPLEALAMEAQAASPAMSLQQIVEDSRFMAFVTALEADKNPNFYTNNAFTSEGNELIATMSQKLLEGNYPAAYNSFFETISNDPYYYTTFSNADYYIDVFGEAVDELFRQKGTSSKLYGQYDGETDGSYRKVWTFSDLSARAAEHKYFYYSANNAKNKNEKITTFTLNIDAAYNLETADGVNENTPLYLYIADKVSESITVNLDADSKRPLILCYKGENNPDIQINLNGHTFRGIIYTPHCTENVHMYFSPHNNNSEKGSFKGTWMSGTIALDRGDVEIAFDKDIVNNLEESLRKAFPGYGEEEDESGDQNNQNESNTGSNSVVHIKLVKKLTDIVKIEKIE